VDIEIEDAVTSFIPRNQARLIAPALEYEKVYWRQGPIKKERCTYSAYFFLHKGRNNYTFLTGHLRRILTWCRQNNVRVNFKGERPSKGVRQYMVETHLEGITLREDQINLVRKALLAKRGIIKAPTRTGKTVIQYAIVSSFTRLNTLLLAHTKDLVNQLADEGERFGFNVVRCYGDNKELDWAEHDQVVVMTRQTCANLLKKGNFFPSPYFDIVMVDEAHHITSPEGQYADILSQVDAPLRFGFTATLHEKAEAELSLEGYIGPLIGEVTIKEGIEKGLLIKPSLVFLRAPKVAIGRTVKYEDAYRRGIVENIERNRLIAYTASEFIKRGSSVLILVTKIKHGENIQNALREIFVEAQFVRGDTETLTRKGIKQALIDKVIMCVITTVVWKEGINIPTLNVCINAAGGKSDLVTMQSVGRVLTKADGKTKAVIVEFVDQSHWYLISHFGERMVLYSDQGWL
jgi:superfamily II DNA or RNA helicase